jgi:hypothetical protein
MVSLYLVRPDFPKSDSVIDEFDGASRLIEVAMDLARIAGDDERALKIDGVWLRPYMREPRVLRSEDIDELLQLIDGLETRLIGTVVDEKWRVRPEQLPELRARTKVLALDDSRGGAELHAVGEGMSDVIALRNILQEAKDQGLYIAVN